MNADNSSIRFGTRFASNIERAAAFLATAKSDSAEIHRLSIVFFHSILEDILREVVRHRFHHGHAEWLKDAQLPHVNDTDRRQTKYSLAELKSRYPGKTIDDIAGIAADNYLGALSFNSATDLMNWVNKAGLKQAPMRPYLDALETGIQRRHKIVHEADLMESSNGPTPRTISHHEVVTFMIAVVGFAVVLLDQIDAFESLPADATSALRAVASLE
jgi:hypothetical protein